jgi:quercetin dioxygenase-like cupin family protein
MENVAVMGTSRPDRLIVNPLSGERIAIRRATAATGGAVLVWELTLAPGGHVPSRHRHPNQEESFTILDGRMRFRVGRRRITAGPGDTIRVAPGTVHYFANPGPMPAWVLVETIPALEMEELLEVAAAMAQDQHSAGRRLPRLIDLALFMRDFRREIGAPYVPAAVIAFVVGPLAWLARLTRADRHYCHIRRRVSGSGTPGT